MAYDYEYPFTRNLGGDGLHDDPSTFDLGHEGESDPNTTPVKKDLADRITEDTANFGGNPFQVCYTGATCKVQFTNALTSPQETALNAHVAAQRVQADWNVLNELKEKKMREFDVRTAELIEEGYDVEGTIYDLRLPHRMFISGLRLRALHARVADILYGEGGFF